MKARVFKEPIDIGTPERQAKGGIVIEPRGVSKGGIPLGVGARCEVECKLDWYFKHNNITAEQHQAGLYIRKLFELAYDRPRITSNLLGARGEYKNITDLILEARKKLEQSRKVMPGSIDAVVEDVCWGDQWAGAARMSYLRDGLTLLAKHWGLV